MSQHDIAKSMEVASASTMLISYVERMVEMLDKIESGAKDMTIQMQEGEKTQWEKPDIFKFETMVTMIAHLSSDSDCADYLLMKMQQLIKEETDEFPYPPLIKKYVAQIKFATLYAVKGTFSLWERILQIMGVTVISKTRVMEEQNYVDKKVFGKIRDLFIQQQKLQDQGGSIGQIPYTTNQQPLELTG